MGAGGVSMAFIYLKDQIVDATEWPWGGENFKGAKLCPVLEYLFENTSGDIVYDSSGNGNNGTKYAGGSFSDSGEPFGYEYYSGAQGEHLAITQAVSAYAISFWLHDNYDPPDPDQILTNADKDLCLKVGSNDNFYLDGSTSNTCSGTYGIIVNNYDTHLAYVHIVLNYVGGAYELYENGAYTGSFSASPIMELKYLGETSQQTGYGGGDCYGALRVYERALTETEILKLYNLEV